MRIDEVEFEAALSSHPDTSVEDLTLDLLSHEVFRRVLDNPSGLMIRMSADHLEILDPIQWARTPTPTPPNMVLLARWRDGNARILRALRRMLP